MPQHGRCRRIPAEEDEHRAIPSANRCAPDQEAADTLLAPTTAHMAASQASEECHLKVRAIYFLKSSRSCIDIVVMHACGVNKI
jgi:hypothetical protein